MTFRVGKRRVIVTSNQLMAIDLAGFKLYKWLIWGDKNSPKYCFNWNEI